MSFKAKFEAGEVKMNVLSCDYALHQDVDATGRPSSITRGGTINIVLEATNDTKLFEWMTNSFDHKDGNITFYKRDSEAELRKIEFKEAYIVSFGEQFVHEGSSPFNQALTISAKEITMGTAGATHKNEWV